MKNEQQKPSLELVLNDGNRKISKTFNNGHDMWTWFYKMRKPNKKKKPKTD